MGRWGDGGYDGEVSLIREGSFLEEGGKKGKSGLGGVYAPLVL